MDSFLSAIKTILSICMFLFVMLFVYKSFGVVFSINGLDKSIGYFPFYLDYLIVFTSIIISGVGIGKLMDFDKSENIILENDAIENDIKSGKLNKLSKQKEQMNRFKKRYAELKKINRR